MPYQKIYHKTVISIKKFAYSMYFKKFSEGNLIYDQKKIRAVSFLKNCALYFRRILTLLLDFSWNLEIIWKLLMQNLKDTLNDVDFPYLWLTLLSVSLYYYYKYAYFSFILKNVIFSGVTQKDMEIWKKTNTGSKYFSRMFML